MAHSSTDIGEGALLTTGVLAVVVASGWSSWLPHQPRNNSADRPGDGNT
jgi:hypothetical protein